jgi:Papain-like cysteine protease AvrRpt2
VLIPKFLIAGSRELQSAGVPVPSGVTMSVNPSVLTHWCWAAVAVGVAAAYGSHSEVQCQVASRVVPGRLNCCPSNAACNSDQKLSTALNTHFDGFDPQRNSLPFVMNELASGRPVPTRMSSGGMDGHYVVIAAFSVVNGNNWFGVCDPSFQNKYSWRVDDFRHRYDGGRSWHYSYKTKR